MVDSPRTSKMESMMGSAEAVAFSFGAGAEAICAMAIVETEIISPRGRSWEAKRIVVIVNRGGRGWRIATGGQRFTLFPRKQGFSGVPLAAVILSPRSRRAHCDDCFSVEGSGCLARSFASWFRAAGPPELRSTPPVLGGTQV